MRAMYRVLPALLLLTSCAWPPDVDHPEVDSACPESWSGGATGDGEICAEWWTEFDNTDVDLAVLIALESNHDLRAAAARVKRAAADARIAGADLKPTLGLNLNASRQRFDFEGSPIPAGPDQDFNTTLQSYGVSLDTSWELDLWERNLSLATAALADLQAAEFDLHGARLSIAGQTVKACFAAAEAREQVALAERTVASYKRSADQIRSRYGGGVGSALDIRLALSRLADAQANLSLRTRQLDATQSQLEVLLGRHPDWSRAVPETLPPLPAPVPAGLPADLVARRPDLAVAERRVASSLSRLEAARASLYPRVTLTAGGGTVSGELSDLLDWDFTFWSLIGNLAMPIFDGGRLRAGVDRADAVKDEALAAWGSAVLNAFAEVETALTAERLLVEREGQLARAAEHAAAAETIALDRYNSGLVDYITVLESQRASLSTRSRHLAVRRELLDNRVDLVLALGGGFAAPEEESEDAQ